MRKFMSNYETFIMYKTLCHYCKKEISKLMAGEVEEVVLCDKCTEKLKEMEEVK